MRLYHSLAITLLLTCALHVLAAPLHRRDPGDGDVSAAPLSKAPGVSAAPTLKSILVRCAFIAVISNLALLYF